MGYGRKRLEVLFSLDIQNGHRRYPPFRPTAVEAMGYCCNSLLGSFSLLLTLPVRQLVFGNRVMPLL